MSPRNRAAAKSSKASEVLIPEKLYFRIGEVARLCHLPAYVLRFWETEFPALAPKKSSTGQRLYRQRDVENMLKLKKLLHEQGFTIAGARQVLKQEARPTRAQNALPFLAASQADRKDLKQVRAGLEDILGLLKRKH